MEGREIKKRAEKRNGRQRNQMEEQSGLFRDRAALLKRVGSIQQAAYVRPVTYGEGRAYNMKAYEVKNGRMQFTAMADKCLDIACLSYKGEMLNFLSKPGLTGRAHYDTNGAEAQRSIMGGLMFTCGLENICAPCSVDGKDYPMHGRMRTTPAEHVCADARWETRKDGTEQYHLTLSGEMREAELFGENLVLRRQIGTVLGEKCIRIRDEITNEAFREEACMLLYHFNIGWPLLSEKCELILPTINIEGRDEDARRYLDSYDRITPPADNEPEQVFLHTLAADQKGNTFAAVYNHELGLGLKLTFNQKQLPYFMEWKSMASGDYVLGLEPANASVYGKLYHMERGTMPKLGALETKVTELMVTILESEEDLKAVKEEQHEKIKNQCSHS